MFAIDLGAIAANDPNVPVVNRDPEAFFRATYLTTDLRKLLDEVLASLAGNTGYNRVVKLRTPFGGGKSHTLASLLHAAKKSDALDGIPEAKGFAHPMGMKASDVLESFCRDIAPPRLESASVLRKGIARGVSESVFAYASGASPALGSDGKFQVNREKVILGRHLADDEIDFDSGFLMVPAAIPEVPVAQSSGTAPVGTGAVIPLGVQEPPPGTGTGTEPGPSTAGPEVAGRRKRIVLTFEATRGQVFKAFPAIANLADKSDGARVRIRIEGSSAVGFDPSWLRNALDEPLDEADIERLAEE